MNTTALDQLKAKISGDSDIIASLSKSISISMRYQSIVIRSIILILLGRKMLKSVDKVETLCFKCSEKCENDFNFRHDLEKAVHVWNEALTMKQKTNFPKFIIKLEKDVLDRIDNKIENYWLASDTEIKDLANSISEKMNQRHAKHALH